MVLVIFHWSAMALKSIECVPVENQNGKYWTVQLRGVNYTLIAGLGADVACRVVPPPMSWTKYF